MIPVKQALEIIEMQIPAPQSHNLPLSQALGCVLAGDVYSDMLMPPFDRATMDGYAVRSADVLNPGAALTVIGESTAGRGFAGSVGPGQAVQIMTGAPVPAGADCVQMVEKTEARGDQVIIGEPVEKGKNIAPAGSEVGPGDKLNAGRYIGPVEMAVLATFGACTVPVFKPPRVALFSTGDELVDVTTRPGADQIRSCNAYSLAALLRSCHIEPTDLGIVPDQERVLEEKMEEALSYDISLATGGVSMGKYDLVARTVEKVGARIHFDRVAIKPGKPLTFATRRQSLFFGLPGNPVSAFVAFEVFVRAALARLMGGGRALMRVQAKLTNCFVNQGPRDYYAPARTRWNGRHWETEVLSTRGSADIFRFSSADSLVVLPADSDSQPGTERTVLLLGDYLERITTI